MGKKKNEPRLKKGVCRDCGIKEDHMMHDQKTKQIQMVAVCHFWPAGQVIQNVNEHWCSQFESQEEIGLQ